MDSTAALRTRSVQKKSRVRKDTVYVRASLALVRLKPDTTASLEIEISAGT
jgi:hypothetical protein